MCVCLEINEWFSRNAKRSGGRKTMEGRGETESEESKVKSWQGWIKGRDECWLSILSLSPSSLSSFIPSSSSVDILFILFTPLLLFYPNFFLLNSWVSPLCSYCLLHFVNKNPFVNTTNPSSNTAQHDASWLFAALNTQHTIKISTVSHLLHLLKSQWCHKLSVFVFHYYISGGVSKVVVMGYLNRCRMGKI